MICKTEKFCRFFCYQLRQIRRLHCATFFGVFISIFTPEGFRK